MESKTLLVLSAFEASVSTTFETYVFSKNSYDRKSFSRAFKETFSPNSHTRIFVFQQLELPTTTKVSHRKK